MVSKVIIVFYGNSLYRIDIFWLVEMSLQWSPRLGSSGFGRSYVQVPLSWDNLYIESINCIFTNKKWKSFFLCGNGYSLHFAKFKCYSGEFIFKLVC